MSNNNRWSRPSNPPPPLFVGAKERDLVKQVNEELLEKIVGQQILYYPINLDHSNFHPLYGECQTKSFLPPVRIYALIDWEGSSTETSNGVIDRRSSITIHFHKRRLTDDQDLFVREGDFVKYGDNFYEIVELAEPKEIWGQTQHKMEISAKCIKSRGDVFNAT